MLTGTKSFLDWAADHPEIAAVLKDDLDDLDRKLKEGAITPAEAEALLENLVDLQELNRRLKIELEERRATEASLALLAVARVAMNAI